jgi:hypothetical protein
MGRRSFISIPIVAVMFSAGCESPTAPDPPNSSTVQVSGRVLAYHGPSEFNAIGGAHLFGWIDAGGRGGPTGRIPLDDGGRFSLIVDRGARVRLYAGGDTGNEIYQPCAVTVIANSNVNRDVRVVNDYDVIGAAVPPVFLEGTRILRGEVYETVPGIGRRPVPFATVTVDGFRDWSHEIGWPTANTRTDSDGRYVLCGLEADATATIYVTDPIHEMFVSNVELSGDTVLDVELTPTNARPAATRR